MAFDVCNIILWPALPGLLVFLVLRVRYWLQLRHRDGRRFWLFFTWPLLVMLHNNGLPIWRCNALLHHLVGAGLIMGLVIDFLYYYGLLAGPKTKQQVLSLLFFIPVLLFVFRGYLDFRPAVDVVLPHYSRCLVWTDTLFQPTRFYFMVPGTRRFAGGGDFQDPNYGKAVFAPLQARFEKLDENGFVHLKNGALHLAVGPLLPESVRPAPGSQVLPNQPLGLAAGGGQVPGIEIHVISRHQLRVTDFFGGYWLGYQFSAMTPKRNWTTQSDAPGGFRVDPGPS